MLVPVSLRAHHLFHYSKSSNYTLCRCHAFYLMTPAWQFPWENQFSVEEDRSETCMLHFTTGDHFSSNAITIIGIGADHRRLTRVKKKLFWDSSYFQSAEVSLNCTKFTWKAKSLHNCLEKKFLKIWKRFPRPFNGSKTK